MNTGGVWRLLALSGGQLPEHSSSQRNGAADGKLQAAGPRVPAPLPWHAYRQR